MFHLAQYIFFYFTLKQTPFNFPMFKKTPQVMLLDIQNLYNKCSVEIFLSIICKDSMAGFIMSL